jgi:hypothetical protein
MQPRKTSLVLLWSFGILAALAASVPGCGTQAKPAENPDDETATDEDAAVSLPPTADGPDAAAVATPEPPKNPCQQFEMDLTTVLLKNECEVPNAKPGDKTQEIGSKVDIKIVASAPSVAPGGKIELTVIFTNKSKENVSLDFALDPTPRFTTEAYDAKTKARVDKPAGNPPPLPKGMPPREATSHATARITLVPNATAKAVVPWDAVRTKWAPEKLKGTPPEMGYPRSPAGPLPKGKYTVRVMTPLTQVFEGLDKEVSGPKIEITVQ